MGITTEYNSRPLPASQQIAIYIVYTFPRFWNGIPCRSFKFDTETFEPLTISYRHPASYPFPFSSTSPSYIYPYPIKGRLAGCCTCSHTTRTWAGRCVSPIAGDRIVGKDYYCGGRPHAGSERSRRCDSDKGGRVFRCGMERRYTRSGEGGTFRCVVCTGRFRNAASEEKKKKKEKIKDHTAV